MGASTSEERCSSSLWSWPQRVPTDGGEALGSPEGADDGEELGAPEWVRWSTDVPETIKMERANTIMEIQSRISWELNQEKIGKVFRCMIDRKEGDVFIGRTEFDSPEVDNEVHIPATATYLKLGDFADIRITDATDYDLYGEPV